MSLSGVYVVFIPTLKNYFSGKCPGSAAVIITVNNPIFGIEIAVNRLLPLIHLDIWRIFHFSRLRAENTSLAKVNDQMTLDLERLLNQKEVSTC